MFTLSNLQLLSCFYQKLILFVTFHDVIIWISSLSRNERIWKGQYGGDDFGPLDVGKTYWYECRNGVFRFNDGHQESYINVTCINDPDATPWRSEPPFWNPPYDHLYNPFPECFIPGKYWCTLKVSTNVWHIKQQNWYISEQTLGKYEQHSLCIMMYSVFLIWILPKNIEARLKAWLRNL